MTARFALTTCASLRRNLDGVEDTARRNNFGIAIAPRAGGPIAIGIGVSPRTLLGSLLFGLVLAPVIGAVAYDRVRRWRAGLETVPGAATVERHTAS